MVTPQQRDEIAERLVKSAIGSVYHVACGSSFRQEWIEKFAGVGQGKSRPDEVRAEIDRLALAIDEHMKSFRF